MSEVLTSYKILINKAYLETIKHLVRRRDEKIAESEEKALTDKNFERESFISFLYSVYYLFFLFFFKNVTNSGFAELSYQANLIKSHLASIIEGWPKYHAFLLSPRHSYFILSIYSFKACSQNRTFLLCCEKGYNWVLSRIVV